MAEQADDLERQVASVVAIGTPVAAVVIAGVSLLIWGPGPAVLVLTAGALIGAVIILWSSLRSLVGDAPIDPGFDEAVVRARVSEADERKRMVLRALKDLENERDIGKIDEADYAALATEYRARAKAILREMDDEIAPQREKAEQIARAYLQKKGLLKAGYRDAQPPEDDEVSSDSVEEESHPRATKTRRGAVPTPEVKLADSIERRLCATCETSNEPDATFCKKCGAHVGSQDDADDEAQRDEQREESEA